MNAYSYKYAHGAGDDREDCRMMGKVKRFWYELCLSTMDIFVDMAVYVDSRGHPKYCLTRFIAVTRCDVCSCWVTTEFHPFKSDTRKYYVFCIRTYYCFSHTHTAQYLQRYVHAYCIYVYICLHVYLHLYSHVDSCVYFHTHACAQPQ